MKFDKYDMLTVGAYLVVILGCLGYMLKDPMNCISKAEIYETDYHYSLISGCYLKEDNQFMSIDAYELSLTKIGQGLVTIVK